METHDDNNDPKEFAESMLRIIQKELPTIAKYNTHLYQNILSAIELTIDREPQQCSVCGGKKEMSDETRVEVDKIIAELNL